MKPVQTGITLSLTVAAFYSLCTLAAVAAPDQFIGFMNSLFHGLDFRKLLTPDSYSWGSFLFALVIMAFWGFAMGTFFAWLGNTISGSGSGQFNE